MIYRLLALFVFFAFSAEAADNPYGNIMIVKPAETQVVERDENLPTCDNQKLIAEVKAAIEDYLGKQKFSSIIDYRAQHLILKNIDEYTEIAVQTFDNKSNYALANEIIMAKINLKIDENNMRICASGGKKPIHLLIYPEDFRYRVEIINFIPPKENGNDFSILYAPQVKEYEKFEM